VGGGGAVVGGREAVFVVRHGVMRPVRLPPFSFLSQRSRRSKVFPWSSREPYPVSPL
jgi:hypothetical protein